MAEDPSQGKPAKRNIQSLRSWEEWILRRNVGRETVVLVISVVVIRLVETLQRLHRGVHVILGTTLYFNLDGCVTDTEVVP